MIRHYENKLVDSIQRYKYITTLNNFDVEKRAEAQRFFDDEINSLIQADKQVFEEALLSILKDTCEYLGKEDTQIKLECAGIYGKRHFRTWIYKICYRYDVLISESTSILKSELKNLFSSNDLYTKLDIASYTNLILDIFEENKKELTNALKNFIRCEDITTFTDLQLYLTINQGNKKVAKYYKLLDSIREVAVIQNMGFAHWAESTRLNKIKNTLQLIEKYGFPSLKPYLSELLDLIICAKSSGQSLINYDNEKIDKIERFVFSTITPDALDIISSNIAKCILNGN